MAVAPRFRRIQLLTWGLVIFAVVRIKTLEVKILLSNLYFSQEQAFMPCLNQVDRFLKTYLNT